MYECVCLDMHLYLYLYFNNVKLDLQALKYSALSHTDWTRLQRDSKIICVGKNQYGQVFESLDV